MFVAAAEDKTDIIALPSPGSSNASASAIAVVGSKLNPQVMMFATGSGHTVKMCFTNTLSLAVCTPGSERARLTGQTSHLASTNPHHSTSMAHYHYPTAFLSSAVSHAKLHDTEHAHGHAPCQSDYTPTNRHQPPVMPCCPSM